MIRVVLADDHPVVRSGIRSLLESAKDIIVIGETDSGEGVLRMVSELVPDLVLLDMELPGISGVEVARQIKEADSPTKILALSAYDDERYIEGLLNTGASGYLTKDEAPDTIINAVRGVAHGEEGWLSRGVTAKVVRQTWAGRGSNPLAALSERELEVLKMLAQGGTNGQMAAALGIAERTVRFHLHNIYDKLDLDGRGQAIVWAVRRGL